MGHPRFAPQAPGPLRTSGQRPCGPPRLGDSSSDHSPGGLRRWERISSARLAATNHFPGPPCQASTLPEPSVGFYFNEDSGGSHLVLQTRACSPDPAQGLAPVPRLLGMPSTVGGGEVTPKLLLSGDFRKQRRPRSCLPFSGAASPARQEPVLGATTHPAPPPRRGLSLQETGDSGLPPLARSSRVSRPTSPAESAAPPRSPRTSSRVG
ncbi:uncharacterized protein LOC117090247 [Trachypithecus francoisi]|uniref:uncharacterized protein LOC117090247 n=1 Tax=Trachypithecus francoisi TaxID=54180 RepID=UPI00141BA3EB|nr:uncharacterized protein LOC117090247 [Trachypithecus francoisi]